MTDLPSTEEMLNLLDQQDKTIEELSQTVQTLQSVNLKQETQIEELLNLQSDELQRKQKLKNLQEQVKILLREKTQLNTNLTDLKDKVAQADERVRKAEQQTQYAITHQKVQTVYKDRIETQYHDKCAECQKEKLKAQTNAYKAKETALTSYVAIFGGLTAIVTILSIIRNKVFCGDFTTFWEGFWNILVSAFKFTYDGISYVATLCDKIPQPIVAVIVHWIVFMGLFFGLGALIFFVIIKLIDFSAEPISNGVNVWNFSMSVIALVAVVFFGDYIKNLIKFNLFGFWIILIIILIGVEIFRKTNKGYY